VSDEQRRQKGIEIFKRNYGSSLMEPPPKGQDPFFDIMLETLFAEVWSREEQLCLRDRRLFTMGVIAAMGESGIFEIQAGCALRNGEMTAEQLRELVIHGAHYAGYPRASGLKGAVEKAIASFEKEQQNQDGKGE